jgi:hypothetical protein
LKIKPKIVADIRNEIEWARDFIHKIKLHLINVSLNTPYTKFKCADGADNSTVKVDGDDNKSLVNMVKVVKYDQEISFNIKGGNLMNINHI